MEQEMASIIKFVLTAAGNPAPYYYSVPKDFVIPAMYFPTPEITSDGETFVTYGLDYAWYISVFAATSRAANTMGALVLNAIRAARNLVPLIDQTGKDTSQGVRLRDPEMVTIDEGIVQIKIRWRTRRPYHFADVDKMMTYAVEYLQKDPDSTVGDETENENEEVLP